MTSTAMKPATSSAYQIDDLQHRTVIALNAAGLPFHHPDHARGRAELAVPDACWQLDAPDDGQIELVRIPDENAGTDPHLLADITAMLLTGAPHRAHRDPRAAGRGFREAMTVVGLDLTASGFAVELITHLDKHFFSVCGEVLATVPGAPDDGAVSVADRGWLTWSRDYWIDHAEADPDQPDHERLTDPAALAVIIADRIVLAVSAEAPHLPG